MRLARRSFFERYTAFVLVAFAVATPLLFYGAFRAVRSNTNRVVDWLPKTFAETEQLRWFRKHFVADQFVVISWDGCRLGGDPRNEGAEPDDPRIERLAKMLVSEGETGGRNAPSGDPTVGQYGFRSVTTGRRLLDQLTAPPLNVPYATAVDRLKGSLIGPDGRQTCVIATLADETIGHFGEVLSRGGGGWTQHGEGTLWQAIRVCEIDVNAVHLGGPPVDNVAIDEEGERTLHRLVGLAGLVGFFLAWCSLRSVRLTLIVFACGLLSASSGLAAVWATGATTDAVLMSMPSLVYVLAISGAIHLINYYRDSLSEFGPRGAPAQAIAHGWRPAVLCSVTTALGLLSLCTSDLTPIRKFGTYSALGVMLMLAVLFLFLPAALQCWPDREAGRTIQAPRTCPSAFWQRFGGWIIRRHAWVTLVCVSLIAAVGWGVSRLETRVDLMKLFGKDARLLQDYQWLEANVGRLVPMEIVLRFDRGAQDGAAGAKREVKRYTLLERAEIVADVEAALAAQFGAAGEDAIGPSVSPATFIPPPKQRRGTAAVVQRTVMNAKLEEGRPALLHSGYLAVDPQDQAELWRISIRIAAFRDVDYGRFVDRVRGIVDPVVAEYAEVEGTLSLVYTGVVPIVYKAQRALLDSLIQSTFWSVATITPLLMLVSRGMRAGIVAMLPNVLPVLVVFGSMGWLGISVDIGSMMSASIALGVAVDDTIHYLTWFRRDLNASRDRHAAILAAYRECANPTLHAALINGLGLSVFVWSAFTPIKQFGSLMLTILLAGVVAELVLLPALLAGPLGSVFRPAGRPPATDEEGVER